MKVEGCVKLDGRPMVNTTVMFVALPGTKSRDATATTNDIGEFRLSTINPGDGAFPGTYKVVIIPPTPSDGSERATTPDEAMKISAKAKPAKPLYAVPEKYTRADKTTLTQEVPAKSVILIDLKSDSL